MEREQMAFGSAKPIIFPYPREIQLLEKRFPLDERAVVLLPENPSQNDLFLARFLAADLVDRYQVALRTVNVQKVSEGERIVYRRNVHDGKC